MGKQIAVTGRSIDDYRRLVSLLKREGYSIKGNLADLKDGDKVVAVVIDTGDMTAYETSVTIMACRAACGLKPITVDLYISGKTHMNMLSEERSIELTRSS